jgi:selenocysteine-specific elongation factor
MPDLAARTGLPEQEIQSSAEHAGLICLKQPQTWFIDRGWFTAVKDRLVRTIREFHHEHPLRSGMAKQDLRSRELPDAPPFLLDALLASASELVLEGENVRARGRELTLQEEEHQARAAIERAFEGAGLAAPALAEVLAKSGVEMNRARALMHMLLREKRLVRVSEDLVFHAAAIENLRRMLGQRRSMRFSVGTFKDWTGVSRKYAIPLLEFLDRERVTRREGDQRLVL